MKPFVSKKLSLYSAVVHGVLASVVVPGLFLTLSLGVSWFTFYLVFSGIVAACYWGAKLSHWYQNEGESRDIKPYVVTPVITLLSAVSAGMVSCFIYEIGKLNGDYLSIMYAIKGGFIIGLFGFILTLPVTILMGVLIGIGLTKAQR